MKRDDFLVEIHTEELPPKALLKLANAFREQIETRIKKNDLAFSTIQSYATPRRLAVYVSDLASAQPDQQIERRGPALKAAFDAQGKPTPACVGFARSCGVNVDELKTFSNEQGEWVAYQQQVPGKSITELMPGIIDQALQMLPTPKRMRWGDGETQFVRPVHSIILLYGDQVISTNLLGVSTGRRTRGHRFHAPGWFDVLNAKDYVNLMRDKFVMVDFDERAATIVEQAKLCVINNIHKHAQPYISSRSFQDEVTGLVEWPVALCGQFDSEFLQLPDQVLISSMQDHQRYFPVQDHDEKLLAYFVTISNIKSDNPAQVIHGNERVIRARLSDAAFFYHADKTESLASRIDRLKGMTYQSKLGTLFDKAERISRLAAFIAKQIHADEAAVMRSGMLCKTDLTTQMVGEFPELQGIMGADYALHDGEPAVVANAIREHYLPRFAGDALPSDAVSQALAIADRIDTLVGTFGINQIPTGDKDPYGLRRAALGIIRILVEHQLDLDLLPILEFSVNDYATLISNTETIPLILNFIQERLRSWYQDQDIASSLFSAVIAVQATNPHDIHRRIHAVKTFSQLSQALNLSIANKRVSHLLAKAQDTDSDFASKVIDPTYFENDAEKELARQLEMKNNLVMKLYQSKKYDEVLLELAKLHEPVNDFFDKVMVMSEDKTQRQNRLLLLTQLRALFLQVADIALLQ